MSYGESLFETFCRDTLNNLQCRIHYENIEVDEDCSEFTVIDGEEADHGTIKCYVNGELFAIKTVSGGDSENIEFTDAGYVYFKQRLIEIIQECV